MLRLPPRLIESRLGLRRDVRVYGMQYDMMRDVMEVYISSDLLSEVRECEVAPVVALASVEQTEWED